MDNLLKYLDYEKPSVDFDAASALMLVQRDEQRLWEVDQALARVAGRNLRLLHGLW